MSTLPSGHFVLTAMEAALDEARLAARAGEVPVGAVLMNTASGEILLRSQNRMRRDGNATSHAELLLLREASKLTGLQASEAPKAYQDNEGCENSRGPAKRPAAIDPGECTLVVTLEPCAMCAGAIVLSRVGKLVFGAWDDKAGMCGSVGDIVRHPRLNHRPQVTGGVMAEESAGLLREFFRERRNA